MQQFDTRSFEEIMDTPMSVLEDLESTYCEMYKDVYGVKARWYRAESVEQARRDLEVLGAELERQIEQDKKYQQEAVAAFEELVKSCPDRETAIRWQCQAYNTEDLEHLEYCLGLPFGYLKKM